MNIREKSFLQRTITKNTDMIQCFQLMADFFMLEFHTKQGYDLLCTSWRTFITKGGRSAVVSFVRALLGEEPSNTMPLSLLSFICYIRDQINQRNFHGIQHELLLNKKEQLRYLKPKKVAEISGLLPLICSCLSTGGISHVVDVGSGLGHISRFLANQIPGISVLRLEAQGQLLEKADKIDQIFTKKSNQLKILSTNRLLQLGPGLVQSFTDILTEVDINNQTTFSSSPILLLGLHPCGDLGPYMVKLFSESHACTGLVMVSCCYLHCTDQGYPLSRLLKSQCHSLSLPVREQACHNIEVYLQRLLDQLTSSEIPLNQHWRSIGEVSLRKRCGEYRARMCFKKARPGESVVEFINRDLTDHGYPGLSEEESEFSENLSKEHRWETWLYYFFYTVKLCLGVTGEHLILSDRLLYLLEQGHKAELRTVFDPLVSPRNQALVALK